MRWRTPVKSYLKRNGVAVKEHMRELSEPRLPWGKTTHAEAERKLFEISKPKKLVLRLRR